MIWVSLFKTPTIKTEHTLNAIITKACSSSAAGSEQHPAAPSGETPVGNSEPMSVSFEEY